MVITCITKKINNPASFLKLVMQ